MLANDSAARLKRSESKVLLIDQNKRRRRDPRSKKYRLALQAESKKPTALRKVKNPKGQIVKSLEPVLGRRPTRCENKHTTRLLSHLTVAIALVSARINDLVDKLLWR